MSEFRRDHGQCDLAVVGSVATIWLSHGKANSLDIEMIRQLDELLVDLEARTDVRVVILTGSGGMFSSGIDLPRLLDENIGYTEALLPCLSGALRRLFSFPKPTIAAINGAAVAGGCLLASACDQRLITGDARIGVNEAEIGVAVPSAAIEVLRHACGATFEHLLLNADLLNASDALTAGLAHEITTGEGLMRRAEELANRLARFDPLAYEMTKDVSRQWAVAKMESLSSTLADLNVLEQWSLPATRDHLRKYLPVKRQFTA